MHRLLGIGWFRRYTIFGACNPPLAHQALQVELEVGLMLPCNVIVYESEKVHDSLETHAHADHLYAEQIVRRELDAKVAIGSRIAEVQERTKAWGARNSRCFGRAFAICRSAVSPTAAWSGSSASAMCCAPIGSSGPSRKVSIDQ